MVKVSGRTAVCSPNYDRLNLHFQRLQQTWGASGKSVDLKSLKSITGLREVVLADILKIQDIL